MGLEGASDLGMGGGFNTNLLAQMLMGIGAGMGSAPAGHEIGGAAAGLGKVGMQQMQTQNFMKMFQKVLGGMPDGGKLSFASASPVGDSKGNVNFSLPVVNPVGPDSPAPGVGGDISNPSPSPLQTGSDAVGQTTTGAAGGTEPSQIELMRELLGGRTQPQGGGIDLSKISNSDLVGLTPENIMQATQFIQGQRRLGLEEQNLRNKPLMDLFEIMHKVAATEEAQARTRSLSKDEQQFPVKAYGVGVVTNKQWSELPVDTREYSIYRSVAEKEGITPVSPEEYKTMSPTNQEKFLRAAMKDPRLFEAAKELEKAKSTTINIGEKERETEKFAGQKYMGSDKSMTDLDKFINDKGTKAKIETEALAEQAKLHPPKTDKRPREEKDAEFDQLRGKMRAKTIITKVETMIKNHHGTIIKRDHDNKSGDVTWTVQWPSGDTTTVVRNVY